MGKKTCKYSALLLVLSIMLIFAGCSSQSANTNIISVRTAFADKHKMQKSIEITGNLVPVQTVNILSKISGQVTELKFNVGDNVNAGDILIALETKTLDAQLEQAKASLQTAEAAVQSAKIQMEQAQINLDTAKKAYDNTKALFDAGAASQSQIDDVSTKLALAQKSYELASGPSQNQAKASLNAAQANINNIKVQIDNGIITSPISGVVTNRNISAGEIASPGAALMTIADASVLKLKGTISQEALLYIKEGQDVDVSVDIYPGKAFKGKIESIGPVSVSTGAYFPVEISIKNTGDLKAGLSAAAYLNMAGTEGIIVPREAVIHDNGQSYVYVIKDNVASKRIVETGIENDKEIEVIKGLDAGEQVAVTNVSNLFDNMPVSVN